MMTIVVLGEHRLPDHAVRREEIKTTWAADGKFGESTHENYTLLLHELSIVDLAAIQDAIVEHIVDSYG